MLPIQYKNIEHMHEGVWLGKIFFDKMYFFYLALSGLMGNSFTFEV